MTITLKEVKEQFKIWNEKAFNNELPTPTFELMQTKTLLGQFCPRKVLGHQTYKIRISTYYDRPFEYYVDTIVHEMLHFYINYKGIKDTSSHGRVWKRMAKDLSNKFGLTITRTSAAGGGACEAVIEKKSNKGKTFEYAILCELNNGNYGAAVAPESKLYKLIPRFRTWGMVKNFVVVKAPWNQTYKLRHLKTACGVMGISKKEYCELMNNKIIDFK